MRLLLVDDEPLARQRLAALVGELGGHEIAGEAADGREAVERAQQLDVDAVLGTLVRYLGGDDERVTRLRALVTR